MAEPLQARIAHALAHIRHPRTGQDVLQAGKVRDIATTTDGKVHLAVMLAPGDDPELARAVREVVASVQGVTDVRIDVRQADAPAEPKRASRALPVMDARAAAPRVPAQTPVAYPALGRIIAVSSGKGGVGKSTVSVNLAVALAQQGARVGLMDADIYGPNIPLMMGVDSAPPVITQGGRDLIRPHEAHGVKIISLGFLIERDQPAIWRGPIVMKIVNQFLQDVAWGTLDYLIVDLPPGTGDAQLSLVQATHVSGAVIVTTPQAVAVGDALRGAKMFERVEVGVLGIVENMSWFECSGCGKRYELFGSGGGERLARELGVPLLAQVPLFPQVREGGDSGQPIVVAAPESGAAIALQALASTIAAAVAPGPRDGDPRAA
jgi:ATP-binding protein involved in chromosome partitioning